jgi:hypothetical protein
MVLPACLVAIAVLAMLWVGPIEQPADYHYFADQRAWLGIPSAADVLSNLGFALIGGYGLNLIWQHRDNPSLRSSLSGYFLFFAGLILTAIGSGWYHLAPDDARLVWDRIPIALACAGLLSAFWCETMGGRGRVTLGLAIFAVASVAWWRYTDISGIGDLRPYLLLQCLPLVLIPLLQWQHHAPRREKLALAAVIALYAIAKVFEVADHSVFDSIAIVGGHTLKHLLAGAASGVIAWSLTQRFRSRD